MPPTGNLINWAWFQVYDAPPLWLPGDSVIVSIDTAMSASELADFSAAVVLQVRGDSAYVLDVLCQRLEYPDLRRKVIELHRRWHCIPDDPFSGSAMVASVARGRMEGVRGPMSTARALTCSRKAFRRISGSRSAKRSPRHVADELMGVDAYC